MTNERNYGGIFARPWSTQQSGWTCFAESPYQLYRYVGNPGEKVSTQGLGEFTVFSPPSTVFLGTGACKEVRLEGEELWIAGVRAGTSATTNLEKSENAYRVQKPWGAEFWLSGKHGGYCFKQIQIRQGHRTSLQLHRFKQETNVLIEGKVRLHFHGPGQAAETVDLDAPVALHILPNHVHRMEALTDLTFLEISTPEVDDVIRLSDDTGRTHGRIEAEHRP